MKSLKFRHNLVEKILDGSKTTTWRLFDDKDLQVGDKLQFIDADEGKEFAQVEIVEVREKTFRDINDNDFDAGHERYENPAVMIKWFQDHYGDQVTLETFVKIIKFRLL